MYLRKAPPIVLQNEALLLMLRIILKLQKEGDKEFFTELPDGRRRYFIDLMSHKSEIEKDPESMEIFQVTFFLNSLNFRNCVVDLHKMCFATIIINRKKNQKGKFTLKVRFWTNCQSLHSQSTVVP